MHTPLKYLAKIGWKVLPPGDKLHNTLTFKREVGLPVIVNGGFQTRALIEDAIEQGCDLVSMARPLIANPDLIDILKRQEQADSPCSFCNRCDARTPISPVGCYDLSRFGGDQNRMERQIIEMCGNPVWPHPHDCVPGVCIGPHSAPADRAPAATGAPQG
jgi:2,4-dienoyl-CoA reductase (NADPH2)